MQLTIFNNEHNEHEERWTTLGKNSKGYHIVVIHTFEYHNNQPLPFELFQHKKPQNTKSNNTRILNEKKYDFSTGGWRQILSPELHIECTYLDNEVHVNLQDCAGASAKGIEVGPLVNEILKQDIKSLSANKLIKRICIWKNYDFLTA